ncbi:Uncharacterized protein ALO80_05928 [Pseudomonas caricapapayae]|nr:Uncharacterized protein ALO80_05928 [Pseudomonas caricapapayae]RMV96814.1 hypothetical protein ALP01_05382 [Pseudomonas caricapapayae]
MIKQCAADPVGTAGIFAGLAGQQFDIGTAPLPLFCTTVQIGQPLGVMRHVQVAGARVLTIDAVLVDGRKHQGRSRTQSAVQATGLDAAQGLVQFVGSHPGPGIHQTDVTPGTAVAHLMSFDHAHRFAAFQQPQRRRQTGESGADDAYIGAPLTAQGRADRTLRSQLFPQTAFGKLHHRKNSSNARRIMARYRSVENDALGQWQLAGIVDGVGLPPHVGAPRIGAGFAATAGVLLAAKRTADFCTAGADIDVGDTTIAARRTLERLGFTQVGGKNARRQALRYFVVQAQGLFEVVIGEHVKDRGKGFVPHHLALARHFGNGWRDVIAVRVLVLQLTLAAKHLTTFITGFGQRVLHGRKRLLVDQRADQIALAWITDAHPGVGCLDAGNHFILDRAMHNQTTQRGAALAGSAHGAEQNAPHSKIKIGAGGQNHCVVATQFENAAAETCSNTRTHFAAHAGAARGADQWHTRVIDQRFTGVTITNHQLGKRCGRIAKNLQCLVEQRLAGQGSQWSLFRGFPDHRVATDQRQRGVPGPDCNREVERADHPDHTQRMPGFTHVVAGTFRGNGQAVQLTRQTDREVADIDHFLNFAQALLSDLACFDRHQFAQISLVLAQHFTKDPYQLATPGGRHCAPLQKCAVRSVDARRHLRAAFKRDRGDLAAINRGVNRIVPLCVGTVRHAQTC